MHRVVPVGSKLLHKKEQERRRQEHRKKLARIRSRKSGTGTLDNRPPKTSTMYHLYENPKRRRMEKERWEEVSRQNRRLIEHMGNIFSEKPNWRQQKPKTHAKIVSLNAQARNREIHRINHENRLLVERLQRLQPFYSQKEMKKDRKKHEAFIRMICEYPVPNDSKLNSARSPRKIVSDEHNLTTISFPTFRSDNVLQSESSIWNNEESDHFIDTFRAENTTTSNGIVPKPPQSPDRNNKSFRTQQIEAANKTSFTKKSYNSSTRNSCIVSVPKTITVSRKLLVTGGRKLYLEAECPQEPTWILVTAKLEMPKKHMRYRLPIDLAESMTSSTHNIGDCLSLFSEIQKNVKLYDLLKQVLKQLSLRSQRWLYLGEYRLQELALCESLTQPISNDLVVKVNWVGFSRTLQVCTTTKCKVIQTIAAGATSAVSVRDQKQELEQLVERLYQNEDNTWELQRQLDHHSPKLLLDSPNCNSIPIGGNEVQLDEEVYESDFESDARDAIIQKTTKETTNVTSNQDQNSSTGRRVQGKLKKKYRRKNKDNHRTAIDIEQVPIASNTSNSKTLAINQGVDSSHSNHIEDESNRIDVLSRSSLTPTVKTMGSINKEVPVQLVEVKASEEEAPVQLVEVKASEEEAPAPLVEVKASEEEAPAPLVEDKISEEGAPAPLVEDKISEEGAPAPLVEDKISEEGAPAPLVEVKASEEAAPAPLVEVKASEEEAPAPLVEDKISEEGAPAPLVEDKISEEGAPAPLVEVKASEEATPAPLVEVKASEEEVPEPSVEAATVEEVPTTLVEVEPAIVEALVPLVEDKVSAEAAPAPLVEDKTSKKEEAPSVLIEVGTTTLEEAPTALVKLEATTEVSSTTTVHIDPTPDDGPTKVVQNLTETTEPFDHTTQDSEPLVSNKVDETGIAPPFQHDVGSGTTLENEEAIESDFDEEIEDEMVIATGPSKEPQLSAGSTENSVLEQANSTVEKNYPDSPAISLSTQLHPDSATTSTPTEHTAIDSWKHEVINSTSDVLDDLETEMI